MGLWQRLFGERKSDSVSSSLELFREIYGGRESHSGVSVTAANALEQPVVLACVRAIAEGVAQPDVRFYQGRAADRRRVPLRDHPLLDVLGWKPNGWQSSFEFRETVLFHVVLTGNAYVFVNRVGIARTIKELIPIEPRRVEVKQRADYSLEYKVTSDNGQSQVFGQDAIWHLRGPSWSSWLGMDAVKLARDAIGLSISLEQGQSEFQKNGAGTSGVLSTKEKLSPERFALLSVWLDKHMPGGERFGKPLIADDGTTYTSTAMSAVDSQLIETRKHQIGEICRAFRVFPQMVGFAGDQAPTFASAEQFFIAHVVHTITPWATRFEQSAEINLLDPEEDIDIRLNLNRLMRGAAADRATYYSKGLGAGGSPAWLTQADVREDDGLDWIEGTDKLPEPTNVAPVAPPSPAGGA
jgi:HK97 family phage portal protein